MIGEKILNYEIKSLLGAGGMGNVYMAEHIQLGRKVAIKMLHPRLASNESLRERFKNEASAMAHLQHPNIVALYDYMESEDGLFLIMEYIEGQELDDYIKNVSGPIPEVEVMRLMSQILSAFQYAHGKGVVHRDIKPSNILLTKEGHVKVLDFGIAKLLGADKSLTKTGTQMGTVFYMSPEQVKGQKVDHRSDIYSLGVTLFQMLTGQAPYSKDTTEFEVYNQIVSFPLPKASSIYPGVSKRLDSIIDNATEKNIDERFQSCELFLQALKNIVESKPPIVSRTARKEKIPTAVQQEVFVEKPKKNAGKIILLTTLIAGLILVGYFAIAHFSNSSSNSGENESLVTKNYLYCLQDGLNFRNSNSVSSGVIYELPYGERIELIGSEESPVFEDDMEIIWQQAKWDNQEGWIAVSIDGSRVVGTEEELDEFNLLYANQTGEDLGFSKMKMWGHHELIKFLKENQWLGTYTLRSEPKETREKELRTIVDFNKTQVEASEKIIHDYAVILESENDKIAIYLKAYEDGFGGYVAGWVSLGYHVNYLTVRKKGNEIPSWNYYTILMNELENDRVATTGSDGGITGWLDLSGGSLTWTEERFVESPNAINLLEGSGDFVNEEEWSDCVNNGEYYRSDFYWEVTTSDNAFTAVQMKKSGGLFSNEYVPQVSNNVAFENTKFVLQHGELQEAKLYIDIVEKRIVLYTKGKYGEIYCGYCCMYQDQIEQYILNRDSPDESYYGC
jgi:serine/threonine protein kinase